MRTLSAANMKSNSKPKHMIPPEGTKIRKCWDLLQAHKGKPVFMADLFKDYAKPSNTMHQVLRQLEDFWGLEIRFSKDTWVLIGEWKGRDYHVYSASQIFTKGPIRESAQSEEPLPDSTEVPFWGS